LREVKSLGVVRLPGLTHFRQANKRQIAEFFGVSTNTIGAWISRGCPVTKAGEGPGDPWVLDALAVAEWRYTGPEADEIENGRPEDFQPSDRKAWFESERVRRELQVKDRELIRVSEVEEVVATAFALIAQELRTLPDSLERRAGLSGEVTGLVDTHVSDALAALATRLEELSPVTCEELGAPDGR
jgi:phage terminase Nu1 subunit (DNA packaging protein)